MEDHFMIGDPTLADYNDDLTRHQKAQKRWKLLQNVFIASHLFKTQEIKVMQDIEELLNDVQSSPTRIDFQRVHSLFAEVIDEHRITEKLFNLIQRSTKRDLVEIERIIENHPRRFVKSIKDPESYLNKKNALGIRPLYEAAKHGYIETIQLLLDYGADCHLKSDLNKKDEEDALQVAIRWGHYEVVKRLVKITS